MNRKILSLALAALLLAAPLTACKLENEDVASTDTGAASTSASTSSDTTAKEPLPRHDYMAANVSADVDINRSAYTNLSLTISNSLKVEDEDVQSYVQNIRYQYRTAVNGTTMVKDQPLSWGDDAYIYYKGFLNGKEFEGGSNWDDASSYKLGLGSGSFIPGFEESLVGVVPNTTSKNKPAEISVTFPEDYGEASLAGKAVIFQVVVEYAVQYTLPEYNRELVETTLKYTPKKEFYASDAALLEEFEEYVYNYLVSQSASKVETAKNAALWDYLTDAATCRNLPQDEVNYYFDVYASEVDYYYQYYAAYSGEQFKTQYPTLASFAVAYFGLAKDADWETEVKGFATELVKRDMITHAIAEQEGMESVTSEEYEAQVQYWIDYYGSQYGTMSREDIIENVGEIFLKESALQEKMGDWLLEQVTFTYEDGTAIVTTTDNQG